MTGDKTKIGQSIMSLEGVIKCRTAPTNQTAEEIAEQALAMELYLNDFVAKECFWRFRILPRFHITTKS